MAERVRKQKEGGLIHERTIRDPVLRLRRAGLILAGVIFAEAATIYDKKNAVQSQLVRRGPRGRLQVGSHHLRQDDRLPQGDRDRLMLALTQEACSKYYKTSSRPAPSRDEDS